MEHLLHLSKDRRLKRLIARHAEPLTLTRQKDIVFYLCASIMSQQLSTKVAHTIRQRFLDLFGGRAPAPEEILAVSPAALRSIGLSNAKVSYVQNVARFAVEYGLDLRKLNKMDNEEVIAWLTQIKGVGRWTAEMLLMFGLAREDKKAFREKLLEISAKWSPYRTYACLYLWRWKDNSPVTAAKKK